MRRDTPRRTSHGDEAQVTQYPDPAGGGV